MKIDCHACIARWYHQAQGHTNLDKSDNTCKLQNIARQSSCRQRRMNHINLVGVFVTVQLYRIRPSHCATTPPFSLSTVSISHLKLIQDQIILHQNSLFFLAIGRLLRKAGMDWVMSTQKSRTSSLGDGLIPT